jgi:hypothetical protein
MSSVVYFTMKTGEWMQNKHYALGFVGRVSAGDGVMLQVAGSGGIILLSICGVQ